MSKRFSEPFKQEAVQLVSAERPIGEVASQLGMTCSVRTVGSPMRCMRCMRCMRTAHSCISWEN